MIITLLTLKVAVFTDRQLTDRTSVPLPPDSLALKLVLFYSGLYMRRAFFFSVLPFHPDVILFLGDYFDGGPYLSDDEWKESLSRFKHIFSLSRQQRHLTIPVYRISGNHDIGYESIHSQWPQVIKWYEKEFGTRNYRFTLGKVEFVAIDAQDMDGNPQRSKASSTRAFVKNVSLDVQAHARVLLTHIPLYRKDDTDCGPNRKSEIINQRIMHSPDRQEIEYLSLFVLTLLALLLWSAGGVRVRYDKQLITSITSSRLIEKDEDQNCEYEMMWDAEGSMHLIKKTLNVAVTRMSETISVERGTTVMRPTAKKNISQELEVSVNVNADVFDPMQNAVPRASKSWKDLVIQRLARTLRMLTIIAAVNVPFYMLLVFKDWID